VACSSPIADQTAPPKAADVTASAARGPDATSSAAKAPVDDHRMPDAAKEPVNVDQPYFEFQVEKQVRSVPGSPQPHYPAALKKAKVSGDVLAQFIVDTTGRADMSTFKVLQTNRQEFADAVRDILPEMRFYPAEIGGQKVKQMVQQPFTFAVSK
jgi:protein TonB